MQEVSVLDANTTHSPTRLLMMQYGNPLPSPNH